MKNLNILILSALFVAVLANGSPSFSIDFDTNSFLKDGKPFQYVSGSIHSYRVPRAYWQDRLDKIKAAGLNAIQVYVYWNEHEPKPGFYDFNGQNDIFLFIDMANKTGLNVIFRAGPYVCGEHDFGGLPWWLLSDGTNKIRLRSREARYMKAVTKWFQVLLPKLWPYLIKNGGPVMMVQVENEYGSYFECDHVYMGQLRDLFRKYLGDDTVLFTTDGNSESYLKCGVIDGVYPTVDFGPGSNITASFIEQRKYAPKGPLVNSEYYTGWLDFWGTKHQKVNTKLVVDGFEKMMNVRANVNFYMFIGGTNFGFSNGADPSFSVQPTSYDYDAPLTEAGDTTQKYLALRDSISKYLPVDKMKIPGNSSKANYGKIEIKWKAPLIDAIQNLSEKCIESKSPESFEKLGQGYGFILYSTVLPSSLVNGMNLSIPGIRDRGYVSIGKVPIGILYRSTNTSLIVNLENNQDRNLHIIVENMGRLNYGNNILDNKGIVSDVYLDGVALSGWTACLTDNFVPNFQTDNSRLERFKRKEYELKSSITSINSKVPGIYISEFPVKKNEDTFLKMDQFTKGIALVGTTDRLTNLGRYWPKMGPQITLYTPGPFMKPNADNHIVLIEFEGTSCAHSADCFIELIDYPIIDNI